MVTYFWMAQGKKKIFVHFLEIFGKFGIILKLKMYLNTKP